MSKILYAVVFQEKTQYYTAFDLMSLIELGALSAHAYCYCFQKEYWVKMSEEPSISGMLSTKVLMEEDLTYDEEPDFVPEPYEEGTLLYSLEEKIEVESAESLIHHKNEKHIEELQMRLIEFKAHLITYKKREYQTKKYIRQLLEKNKSLERRKNYEIKTLMGEVFEVNNKPEWVMKKEGQVVGPYRFSLLYSRYKDGILSPKVLVKKKHDKIFTRIGQIYEFNTKIFSRSETVKGSGKKKTRYFVKRTHYRVPFYEVAQIRFGDEAWKVNCINLSVGGCQLQISKLPEYLELNKVLNFTMISNVLGERIECQIIIKNIIEDRVARVGCEFLDLSPRARKVIEAYIKNYVDHEEKGAQKLKAS